MVAVTLGLCGGLAVEIARADPPPVFTAPVPRSKVAALEASTAFVRGLSEEALTQLVPTQSGLHFVGCPNCKSGTQENQLDWDPQHPDEVFCKFCGERYPSAKYPMTQVTVVTNPLGQEQRYPYWADAKGYRYYFAARRDDLVKDYLAARARELAQLYTATGDRAYARRAALIVARFAEVFPGWCYHYDMPFKQKEIFSGVVPPEKRMPNFRTARWSWWAYMDIPIDLLEAYDRTRASGVYTDLSRERGYPVAERVERDLFRNAADEVLQDREDWTNMSPSLWRTLALTGRVLNEAKYDDEAARRVQVFASTRFFYDATWPEASPDYARQTVGELSRVVDALKGTGPGGVGMRVPLIEKANAVLQKMRYPDGRSLPINDTWPNSMRRPTTVTRPYLLPGLGHACLGGGSGANQMQVHLRFAGGYGHEHEDSLGILLYANGREMLSDLGYTHTRDRAWTIATAAHNTVVIDQTSQKDGNVASPTDGSLRFYDVGDPRVQVVSADGLRAYPDVATTYRRTLVAVDCDAGSGYVVDVFEVEGGHRHDYFLHGGTDGTWSLNSTLNLATRAALLPQGMVWQSPRSEADTELALKPNYAYGFLRDLKTADAPPAAPLVETFQSSGGTGLRVTLLPEPDSQLITGVDPSIALAKENDAKLDQFTRPFLALRHEPFDGHSVFVSVLEPFAGAPKFTSVERLRIARTTAALRIRSGDRTDLVVVGARSPVDVPVDGGTARFQGMVGFLSIRGGRVDHGYALGAGGWTYGNYKLVSEPAQTRWLHSADKDGLVIAGPIAGAPSPGDVVRLLTDDGWVYPFTVVSAQAKGNDVLLQVAEGPGMEFDGRQLRLTAFPQRVHSGGVKVEWMPNKGSGSQPAGWRRNGP